MNPPADEGDDPLRCSEPVAARLLDAVRIYDSGPSSVRALDHVSLSLPGGRLTAIVGASGSGKSTLLHCLAGLDNLTSGKVFIGSVELGSLDDRQLTLFRRDQVGVIFQSFNLVPGFDVAENITLPLVLARQRPDQAWFDHIVGALGLGGRLHHTPAQLSGGEQQRVAAARALMSRPRLILADEPTGNLDSHSSQELLGILRRAVDEFGQTVVMVTHDAAAAVVADGAITLADGRVLAVRDAFTQEPLTGLANLDSLRPVTEPVERRPAPPAVAELPEAWM